MSETENQAGVETATADQPRDDLRPGGRVDVFSSGRRRRAVAYLAERDGPASFDELVVAITAAETGTPPDALDESTTRPIAIALHHAHLPKLVHEGYVRAGDDGLRLTVDEAVLESF